MLLYILTGFPVLAHPKKLVKILFFSLFATFRSFQARKFNRREDFGRWMLKATPDISSILHLQLVIDRQSPVKNQPVKPQSR